MFIFDTEIGVLLTALHKFKDLSEDDCLLGRIGTWSQLELSVKWRPISSVSNSFEIFDRDALTLVVGDVSVVPFYGVPEVPLGGHSELDIFFSYGVLHLYWWQGLIAVFFLIVVINYRRWSRSILQVHKQLEL